MNPSRFFALVGILCAAAHPCHARNDNRILLFDLPTGAKGSNIDLTDYVARDLESTPGFDPVVFKRTVQSVRDAVSSNALSPDDVKDPITAVSARAIAKGLGFQRLLRLSGRSTPDGVAAEAEMEKLSGQQSWTSVFVFKLSPYKPKGNKPSLIEGIKAQAALIVQRVTGSPSQVITEDAVAVKVGGKQGESAAKSPVQPDAPAKSTESTNRPEPPGPAATPRPSGPAYDVIADRYRREGDKTNLIVALRKAINDRPRDAALRRELVHAYLDRGLNSAARDEASRAAILIPGDSALRRILGEAYLKTGDSESALRELNEAVKANPNDVAAMVAIGDVYLASAKVPEAEKAFLDAARLESKNMLPHRRLARLYADRGQFADALNSIKLFRGEVKDEEADSLISDYAGILGLLEAGLSEVLSRIQANRQALINGSRTREQGFTQGTSQRKRAEEIAGFLDAMPSIPSLGKIQALYGQAAGFVIQAAEASLLYVESQDSKRDQEAALLRLEATRAISDASKRLQTAVSKPSSDKRRL